MRHDILIVIVAALTTAATRFAPFLIFGGKRPTPRWVTELGKVLPFALIGMLVVYCLKDVEVIQYPYGLPELIACAVTAGLHFWKRNYLISIAVGTVLYMLLVQLVF